MAQKLQERINFHTFAIVFGAVVVFIDVLSGFNDASNVDVRSNDREIASLKIDVGSNDREIASVKRDVSSHDREISSLKRGVSSNDIEIASVKRDIASVESDVAKMERALRAYETCMSRAIPEMMRDFVRNIDPEKLGDKTLESFEVNVALSKVAYPQCRINFY